MAMIGERHHSQHAVTSLDDCMHRVKLDLDLGLSLNMSESKRSSRSLASHSSHSQNFNKRVDAGMDDDLSSSSTTTTASLLEENENENSEQGYQNDNEDCNCSDANQDVSSTSVNTTGKNMAGSTRSTRTTISNSFNHTEEKIFGCMSIRTQEESIDANKHARAIHLARLRRQMRVTGAVSFASSSASFSSSASSVTFPSDDVNDDTTCEHHDQTTSTAQSCKANHSNNNSRSPSSSARDVASVSVSVKKLGFRRSTVRFDSIQIQSYPIILGDNPSVSKGAPISIGWEPFAQCEMTLDRFEASRPPRRWKPQLKIPFDIRYDILERAGEVDDDVEGRVKEIELIKKQRAETERSLWKGPHQEGMERLVRYFKNITSPKKKEEEREFLSKSKLFDEAYSQEANRLAELFCVQTRRSSLELYGSCPCPSPSC